MGNTMATVDKKDHKTSISSALDGAGVQSSKEQATPQISHEVKANNIQLVPAITQEWSILDIANKRPPASWESLFQKDANCELETVSKIVENNEKKYGKHVYPLRKDTFKAFEYCKVQDVKVIIVGQDPYPDFKNGAPVAQGMAFSVPEGVTINPSLQVIFKELVATVPGFKCPPHGNLIKWAQQGVLLLNTCLHFQPGAPKRSKPSKIWHGFIVKALEMIAKHNPSVVVLMFGRIAQEFKNIQGFPDAWLPFCITGGHPSPLNRYNDFLGRDYFKKCNEMLIKSGKVPIDWKL